MAVKPTERRPLDKQIPLLPVRLRYSIEESALLSKERHRPLLKRGRGLHDQVVVHRAQEPRALRRGDHPADPPAGGTARLRNRVHHEGPVGHPLEVGQVVVAMPVERDVLVDLVGDREEIVFPAELREERQLLPVQDLAGRVLGRVHHERADRRRGDGCPHFVAVEPPGARLTILTQGHEPRHEAEDRRLRRVELVVGLHHDHFVTGFQQRTERDGHPLARPEHHRDLFLGIGAPDPIERFGVVRDRVPELRNAEGGTSTG